MLVSGGKKHAIRPKIEQTFIYSVLVKLISELLRASLHNYLATGFIVVEHFCNWYSELGHFLRASRA